MGRLFRAGDADALAESLDDVIRHRHRYMRTRDAVADVFSFVRTIGAYEAIFAGTRVDAARSSAIVTPT